MAKIALVGDAMLDVYHYCINRDNPESSAPCYTVKRSESKPGGAANVAVNLKSLGGDNADFQFVSVVGNDTNAEVLKCALSLFNIPHKLVIDSARPTVTKMRFFDLHDRRYHERFDFEDESYIEDTHVGEILDAVSSAHPELIIVSDYKKGVVSENLMNGLRNLNVPIIVDPKSKHKLFYKGVFLIKPNRKDVREMTGLDDVVLAGERLRDELGANVLLSRSEDGVSYFGLKGERYDFPANAAGRVVDATGAGDSVIATFAHFFVKGKSVEECVRLANRAGGVAVGYPGCYNVTEKDILGRESY